MTPPSRLIVICGHAIWLGGPSKGSKESEWLIQPFQKGEIPAFYAHINVGAAELAQDPESVLVFSGGPTSPKTKLSEAASYHNLALANRWLPLNHPRVLLEERAMDSYHNILFSLVLFWEKFGVWPRKLTIISHAFKRERLVNGHCKAIGFPLDRIQCVAISGSKAVNEQTLEGTQLTLGQWKTDPHGIGEELSGKRRGRNHWGVGQRLFGSEEERERAGVDTRLMEDGGESLVEGGRRPWAI
ncbi:hypothetical protein QBC38DRAFT_37289 [Podospora fimiseda]|uniref:DUF218 domain-containing protein n=1 Tax=Podospora fimiseda TaxID=252190 RepID=A0AAN7GPM5_9PEZI|nr:hypothetical protein QBC38DRAFT_37289 [Podospora fimiseda]